MKKNKIIYKGIKNKSHALLLTIKNSKHFYGMSEKQYKNSIFKEVFRKSLHMCSCFIPLLIYHTNKTLILFLLSFVLLLYLTSEVLRLKKVDVPFVSHITKIASRKRDENKVVLGPITLVTGIILALILFPLKNASIGIYALAFGDGMASLCGKLFGKVYIPFTNGKTIEGSLSCFMAVFISSFCVTQDILASFILAFFTMAIELIPINDIDNVVIPFFTSLLSLLLL